MSPIRGVIESDEATAGTEKFNFEDCTAAPVTKTLPPAEVMEGEDVCYVKTDTSANALTVACSRTAKILGLGAGATSYVLGTQGDTLMLHCRSGNWYVIFAGSFVDMSSAIATEVTNRNAAIAAAVAAVLAPIYGDAVEGDGNIVADETLTGHRYFHNCTIAAGKKITTNGWGIFCTGTLTLAAGAKITSNGETAASDAGGLGARGDFYPAGAAGGDGKALAGDNGLGTLGFSSGASGGDGGGSGLNAGGTGGSPAPVSNVDPRKLIYSLIAWDGAYLPNIFSSGGGGGGAGDGVHLGGGGGGGGGSVVVAAPTIVLGAGAALEAKGGNGSDGIDPDGGGGGSGGGGVIIVVTRTDSNDITPSCNVGAGSAGAGAGTADGGTNGADGQVIVLKA